MTAAAITQQQHLYVEKALAEYKEQIKSATGIAWQIATTALWNTLEFSQQETDSAKSFISGFLQQGTSHKKSFDEFTQRVLLARQYINSHPGKYIPVPSVWFSQTNSNGFAGTAKWYNTVQQTRQSLPLYKQSLNAFAPAVSETIRSGSPLVFHRWRSWFIQHNAQGLLNLFLSTLANNANRQV